MLALSLMRFWWHPSLAFIVCLGISAMVGICVAVAGTSWVTFLVGVMLDGVLPLIDGSGVFPLVLRWWIRGIVWIASGAVVSTYVVLCQPLKVARCPFAPVPACSPSEIDVQKGHWLVCVKFCNDFFLLWFALIGTIALNFSRIFVASTIRWSPSETVWIAQCAGNSLRVPVFVQYPVAGLKKIKRGYDTSLLGHHTM